jgi:hypothetical protein
MRALGVLFALTALILSGCSGGKPTATTTAPADVFLDGSGTGVIEVTVVDDAHNPLGAAQVAVREITLSAATDVEGKARFRNIPAGEYTVIASAIGFEQRARRVTVVDDDVVRVQLILPSVAIEVAYHDTIGPFNGYFECRMGTLTSTGQCGFVCVVVACVNPVGTTGADDILYPNDASVMQYNLTSERYRTIVGDMRWNQGSAATSTALRFAFSHDEREPNHWWCSAEGPSPLSWRYEREGGSTCANVGGGTDAQPEPTMDLGLRTYANVPFGRLPTGGDVAYVAYQQRFEMVTTIFYGDWAPEGYSAFL